MILTAHQPVYLPWLGLFHKIALADRFVCYDHVARSHYDYTARNQIRTANGSTTLIVPLRKSKESTQPLKDVRIDTSLPWRKKHWKTIENAYRKAPYYDAYAPFLGRFYEHEWAFVTEMNTALLSWLLDALGIPREIESSSALQIEREKSEGVLEMSLKLKAKIFIFGALGRDYADVERFRASGVEPVFQDYRHPTYQQLHGEFASHLSVIDLLFNCGPQSLAILQADNLSRHDLERGT
jgi:hypothetical protein